MNQSVKLGLSGAESELPELSRALRSVKREEIKQQGRSADGTLRTDFVAVKKGWVIGYSVISEEDIETIEAILDLQYTTPASLSMKITNREETVLTYEVFVTMSDRGDLLQVGDYYYRGLSLEVTEV